DYDGRPLYSDDVLKFDDFGFYTSATYHINDHWDASLRAEYVENLDKFTDRWRVSPAVTWSLNRDRNFFMRLQYNFDHDSELGKEHGAWLGFGINWGGSEVR
ncbi:MAG: hypothetical protein ACKVHP_24135, partial [Verrucomicrobiales bacterium]